VAADRPGARLCRPYGDHAAEAGRRPPALPLLRAADLLTMPTIEYVQRNFTAASLRRIEQANEIVTEYAAQGFDLTLRQLY
jgi:hypothetical protein